MRCQGTVGCRSLIRVHHRCTNRQRPVLVNVGRGNIIAEQTITRALDQGWISYAILDVFPVEPLPAESSLWARDDVLITPHIAANTRAIDVVDVVLSNYRHLVGGGTRSLDYVIDFDRGY